MDYFMMDVLHVSQKEIDDMTLIEYSRAIDYSGITVLQRRLDFNLARIFGKPKKGKGKDKGLTYDLDFRQFNPVYQALQKERGIPKKVPDKVKEAFKNE